MKRNGAAADRRRNRQRSRVLLGQRSGEPERIQAGESRVELGAHGGVDRQSQLEQNRAFLARVFAGTEESLEELLSYTQIKNVAVFP